MNKVQKELKPLTETLKHIALGIFLGAGITFWNNVFGVIIVTFGLTLLVASFLIQRQASKMRIEEEGESL